MRPIHALTLAALAAPALTSAQQKRTEEKEPARTRIRNVWVSGDDDRPRLGISISAGSRRDTLGILVSSVTPGGAAEKAGIEEGDRLAAINGVSLRLSKDDVDDEEMSGVAQRRLLRELEKHKAGEEVELRVWSGGQARTVKAKLQAPEERMALSGWKEELENRAAIGVGLGAGGSRRDTLGILVTQVTEDGPAEKAGIVEGDRLAAINGVDLRVAREDAGDASASGARYRRLSREMEKVKVGDDVELRVYSGGQSKTVRVKAAKASDVGEGSSFFFSDGPRGQLRMSRPETMVLPRVPRAPMEPMAPKTPAAPREPRLFRFDDGYGDFRLDIDPRYREEIRNRVEDLRRSFEGFGRAFPRVRVRVNGGEIDDADDEDASDAVTLPRVAPRLRLTPGATVVMGTRRA